MDTNWAQLIIDAIQLGVIYTLVALGLTMIFSIMNVINFAHGEIYALGGFATYYIFLRYLSTYLGGPGFINYFLTLGIVFLLFILLGFFLEKAIFRPFRGNLLGGLLVSVGFGAALQTAMTLTFGPETKGVPGMFSGRLVVLGAAISGQRAAVVVLGAVIISGLYIFLKKTKIGIAMTAVSQEKEAAESLGIDYSVMSSLGLGIGCALAGIAAVLVVPVNYVDPFVGHAYLMKAFIIIVIGGLGSFVGCLFGGFILGIIESFGGYFLDMPTSNIISFSIVISFLILRPKGLFGREEK